MSAAWRLLVVDDDAAVRRTVGDYLGAHGFETTLAADAAEARALLESRRFDLAVLDLRMPGEDGLSLARHLRERHPQVRIIMLTAAGELVDRIVGLELGADDYLAKPAELPELAARVRAVLRARGEARPPASAPIGIPVGEHRLDRDARVLRDGDGREIPITAMDFAMLEALVDNPNRILTRGQLSQIVRGRDRDPSDRSVDIRIGRLRRKIEPDPSKPRLIKTVHGVGYRFTPDGG